VGFNMNMFQVHSVLITITFNGNFSPNKKKVLMGTRKCRFGGEPLGGGRVSNSPRNIFLNLIW
jgi:hypothetical protein